MRGTSLFNSALEMTQRIWELEPVRGVRMPVLEANERVVDLDALWTDGGLRPSSNNLAFFIQNISNPNEVRQWERRLRTWPIRGGLLIAEDELHLLTPRSSSSSELKQTTLNLDTWRETLVSPKPHLFTPKALARFREGQLSLSDLEENVSERSFTFLSRQQERIDEAFQKGINSALELTGVAGTNMTSSRIEIRGHIIRYAIAYLAARILQDKNFFGIGSTIHDYDQSPTTLLDRMIRITNGFFSRAKASEEFVPDLARQALANFMGSSVSFMLTDHRDVGRLYERAIKKLPKELSSDDWGDLNRYYTPVKLAERMLDALPIERLRPEERFIFDPAAGSGSLLLAATSRLAKMTDIPRDGTRSLYLKTHVAGNDLDRYAKLIAQLRYFLASESLGKASEVSEDAADILPFPVRENFSNWDYEQMDLNDLSIKPKVIVANPPFAEEGRTQKAAKFVEKALSWLDNGSQFAFVLPQSFLVSTTHGMPKARKLLDERCQILEVWQYPEGAIGTTARQDTCILIGTVGSERKSVYGLSKAVFSRVDTSEISNSGFSGQSWIAPILTRKEHVNWASVTSPPVNIDVDYIPLGSLFFVFAGVTPNKGQKAIQVCPEGIVCKLNWKLRWHEKGKLWANPGSVPQEKRWIKYGPNYLKRSAVESSHLLDLSKVLIGRDVNRGTVEPLRAHFDTVGLCPDRHLFCIVTVEESQKYNDVQYDTQRTPQGWGELSSDEKKLWLTGILSSELVNEISLIGRNSRGLSKDAICQFPLPTHINRQIIDITQEIISLEQKDNSELSIHDNYRELLNRLVEESYGNPTRVKVARTGKPLELEEWQNERKKQTRTALGQVLEVAVDEGQVCIYISRLMEDDNIEGEWMPLPQELPGWALDGTPFEAELSIDIKTFDKLRERPWALRRFRHTPRPYLTDEELDTFLKVPDLEVQP